MAGQIAPTKSNLMRIQEELQLSKQGYELLDQKRNILEFALTPFPSIATISTF